MTDSRELLLFAVLAVDDELRTLTAERDQARRLALAMAEKLATLADHLAHLAERPDRRDAT